MARFGAQAWIDQVMEGVRNAVQNGIENLSGSSISVNSHPEDGYRFRARTAEEIKQSQALVPPVRLEDLPPADEEPAPVAQATPPKAKRKPEGWIL